MKHIKIIILSLIGLLMLGTVAYAEFDDRFYVESKQSFLDGYEVTVLHDTVNDNLVYIIHQENRDDFKFQVVPDIITVKDDEI